MLNEKQITENWEEFIALFDQYDTKRWQKLKSFHESNVDRIALMPASTNVSFHNAFPGGYVDHVLRVHRLAFHFKDIWENELGDLDFPDESLSLVALVHDIGKFGDKNHELYVDQDEQWQIKRGSVYKNNPNIAFMKGSDRSLFNLHTMGVRLSEDEYLAIRLHDGLFEESNKSYLISYSDEYKLRSSLAHILHQADFTAAKVEFSKYKK